MRFTLSQRINVFTKYNGKCAYCGCDINIRQMQVDHIIPKCDFIKHVSNKLKVPSFLKHLTVEDMNHIDNLNPSCAICNKWKSFNSLESFRDELKQQTKRLNEYSSNYRIAKKYGLVSENEIKIKFHFEKSSN